MPAYPQFVGPSYVGQSPIVNGEFSMNLFVEHADVRGGKAPDVLLPIEGVTAVVDSAVSPGRGAFTCDNRTFLVLGNTLFEYDGSLTLTSRGTMALDQYPATLCCNGDAGTQLFVTSGNNGYILNLATNVFTLVRTGATRQGAFLDGYFIALDADTSTFYLSDLNDGTTWDPTQFAQRSIRPDPWVSMIVHDRFLWLLGTESSEVWYNAGSFPFPFVPHPSGLVEYGTDAAWSPQVVGDSLVWLARTRDGAGQVVRSPGFSASVISTQALQVVLDELASRADGVGMTYQHRGHQFYILTFPAGNLTVAYDATTGLWHDRGTWSVADEHFHAWRPLFHTYGFHRHLVLDREGSVLYELTETSSTDVEDLAMRCVRRPPVLWKQGDLIPIGTFALDVEPGLAALNQDQRVAMRASRNGGKTWGNERSRSMGLRGEYITRVEWARCGAAITWQPEVVWTEPSPFRCSGARFDAA